MLKFILRRTLATVPVLFLIFTGSFFLIRAAPGGPFDAEKRVAPEILRQMEAYYGMDQPLWRQYLHQLDRVALHADLGPSLKYATFSVNDLIAGSLPVSLELGCYGMAIALLLGVTVGVVAALRPNTLSDYLPMSLAMTGICVPTFVFGPLLILLFALKLRWFNPSGWSEPADRVLPALTLGIFYAAYLARLTRGGMLEVLSQDFIRTARAKGASEARVVCRHALRGGLLPVVSFLGPAFAGIISGSFVVESIFSIPGLGRYFVTAAFNRDYNMVLGTVLCYAALVVLFNLVTDILQVWLNPRLKFE
jgi:oligopeptide transport system permease protein